MSGASPVKIPHAEPPVASGLSHRHVLLAAAGYLVIALALFWPLPLRLATHMAGDPFGDPLLNAWILGWDAERLTHGLQGWWDAPIFYPFRDALAWSEHLLGIAIFVAPAYWATKNIVLQYNLALLWSVLLAGLGMYLLAYEVTGRRSAAWLAGVMFACLPYRVAHVTHLQVLAAGWMPLALLALHRYFRTGSRRALAGFAAAFVLTALSNGYYLFFLAVPAAIVVAWHSAERWRRGSPVMPAVAGLAGAALAIGLALSPVIAAYLRVKLAHGFTRTRGEMVLYSAKPRDFRTVTPDAQRWGGALPLGPPERQLFPGIALTLLSAAGLLACRRYALARPYVVIAPVAALLTLGPEPDVWFTTLPHGPYDALLALPGVGGLRVPARFAMVMYLAMCVLAAAGASRLLGAQALYRRRALVVALATCFVFIEGRPAAPVVATTRALSLSENAYRWLETQPEGAVLELPAGGTRETVQYMAGTLIHRHPIVNGYSGYGSALQDFFAGPPSLEPTHADALLEAAAAIGVRYVLVHEHLYQDRAYGGRLASALRKASPTIVRAARTFDFTTAVRIDLPPPSTPRPLDPALSLTGCELSASHSAESASRAIDGNRATRWLSGPPQDGSEWLSISCRETLILTGLDIAFSSRSLGDYPRRLRVERSIDGTAFETVFEGFILDQLARSLAADARQPHVRLALPPGEFRTLRLRQVGRAERPSFWAVDDLVVRGR
jgi:hypothetical protein